MANRSGVQVLAIQHAVANASPSSWRDAIVVEAGSDAVSLMCLDGTLLRLASSVELAPGDPVAFHPVAELLAAGGERHRARLA